MKYKNKTRIISCANSALTCAIVTLDPSALNLQLKRLGSWKVPPAVIVLDGANGDMKSIEEHPRYRRSKWVRRTSLYQRIGSLSSEIETPFCVLLTDDDFFLETGLMASVNALLHAPSAGTCVGGAMSLVKSENPSLSMVVAPRMGRYLGDRTTWDNQDASPEERVDKILRSYKLRGLWSVQRTSVLASIANVIGQFPEPSREFHPVFFEATVEILSALLSPQISVRDLTWIRRDHTYHQAWPAWGDVRIYAESEAGRKAFAKLRRIVVDELRSEFSGDLFFTGLSSLLLTWPNKHVTPQRRKIFNRVKVLLEMMSRKDSLLGQFIVEAVGSILQRREIRHFENLGGRINAGELFAARTSLHETCEK